MLMGTVFQPPSSTSGRPRPGTRKAHWSDEQVPATLLRGAATSLPSSDPQFHHGVSVAQTRGAKKKSSVESTTPHTVPSSVPASNSLMGGPGGPPRRLSLPLAISCCTFMCSRCSSISASLWIWSIVLGPWSPRRGTQLLCGIGQHRVITSEKTKPASGSGGCGVRGSRLTVGKREHTPFADPAHPAA